MPDSLEKFGIGSIPEAAPVDISAQLANSTHELATTHLGHDTG